MNAAFGKKIMGLVAVCALLGGCATLSKEPVAPEISFINFKSIEITPEGVQFQVKMLVKNLMAVKLPVDKLDYSFDLDNKPFLTGSYDQFNKLNLNPGQGREVVLPFLLSWENLAKHAIVREDTGKWYFVSFRGTVYLGGGFPFDSVPFKIEKWIPVPQIPQISFAGTDGNPFGGLFKVNLNISNLNSFPLTVKEVKTILVMNKANYDLIGNDSRMEWNGAETKTLTLTMNNDAGKGISMLGNVFANRGQVDLQIKGKIIFETEFGDWTVPFETAGRSE